MSISISNLIARKKLKNPNDEIYEDVSLTDLADWHSKHSWPTGTGTGVEVSPVSFPDDKDINMEAFGHDDAHVVSSCIHYIMMKPETPSSRTVGYDTITSESADAEVKFRVRGFRNDADGLAKIRLYHATDQAAQPANPYDKTISGVGTTTATAAHFTGLGGANDNTIGFHIDSQITYFNQAGDAGATIWNRNQIGQGGGGGGGTGMETYFERHPSNIGAGSFERHHCLVFVEGPQCSSLRWSGKTLPVTGTFSSWMVCQGEQGIGSGGQYLGRVGYSDYPGSPNRHGTTA